MELLTILVCQCTQQLLVLMCNLINFGLTKMFLKYNFKAPFPGTGSRSYYSPSYRVRSIAVSLSVCLSVCSLADLKNYMSKLCEIFCKC